MEGVGFAAGAATSAAVVYVGEFALTLALAATPAGWVLIVGGIGIAAAATLAALHADRVAQEQAATYHDSHVNPAQRKP